MNTKTKGRVVVSQNFIKQMRLAEKVYDKHQKDGANSLLNDIDDADWAVSGPLIKPCMELHDQAEDLIKQAEKIYRERDAKAALVKKAITSSKNLLKGRYTNSPKKLADWGFVVDDTPKVKKPKPKAE